MAEHGAEDSPIPSVLNELERLKGHVHETLVHYEKRLEAEINVVREILEKQLRQQKLSHAKLRDLRDMLTLLRHVQLKADKGRREDLKKLESVLSDLTMLIENW